MPETDEDKFRTGLAVLEMSRTAGWQWLENEIRRELDIERKELRQFELEGLSVGQIAAGYLRHRAGVEAFEKILFMVEAAIKQKDEAAWAMKRE